MFVVIAAGAAGRGVTEPTDEIGKGAAVDKPAGRTAVEEVALEGSSGVLPSGMEDIEVTGLTGRVGCCMRRLRRDE
jgi:hypothetical protein